MQLRYLDRTKMLVELVFTSAEAERLVQAAAEGMAVRVVADEDGNVLKVETEDDLSGPVT